MSRLKHSKKRYTPEKSVHNPIIAVAPHDLVGTVARLRPIIGQLGTNPGRALPNSHNGGDFGQFLVESTNEYGITKEQFRLHRWPHGHKQSA